MAEGVGLVGAPPRLCKCGCKRSLEGMRSDAKWASEACYQRAKRARSTGRDEVERFMASLPSVRVRWRGRRAYKGPTGLSARAKAQARCPRGHFTSMEDGGNCLRCGWTNNEAWDAVTHGRDE